MRFLANGPDIPEDLLRAHEEGEVVFFCGAGISRPAGLPDFGGLVEQVFENLNTPRNRIQQQAFKSGQYDQVLELLERDIVGGGRKVREALFKALQPKRPQVLSKTHKALLQLGNQAGKLRLVTTNFDRLFEAARAEMPFKSFTAPLLPVPKRSTWNGLVYLHGLLPEIPEEVELNRLVVTSGNFGSAYLLERWASRFIGDLFRNFKVCFVGYSINDPVLRYMMDALAAERRRGEDFHEPWAFGDCLSKTRDERREDWEAKGVQPILYEARSKKDHSVLHKTLQRWAEVYRDGVRGKERLVVRLARAMPSETGEEDFVAQLLWAISDPSGIPAKAFAETRPVPRLEWLFDAFAKERFSASDLHGFGLHPSAKEKKSSIKFSLLSRPAGYDSNQRLQLAYSSILPPNFDAVVIHLAGWLLHYLDDEKLLVWLAAQGGRLHPRFLAMISHQLQFRMHQPETQEVTASSEEKVPPKQLRKGMQALWNLLCEGRIIVQGTVPDAGSWLQRLKKEGMTRSVRSGLREILKVKIEVRERFWLLDPHKDSDVQNPGDLVRCDLVFANSLVRHWLMETGGACFRNALPEVFDDLQALLLDALELRRELGQSSDREDDSHFWQPSISEHKQNTGYTEWTLLIELLRDAWLGVYKLDPAKAGRRAQAWWDLPYSVFKRLALFAASQADALPASTWLEWLLSEDERWLWSIETKREVCRLLALQGQNLDAPEMERLTAAILSGPPRSNFREDLEYDRWDRHKEEAIWLRLKKLSQAKVELPDQACRALEIIELECGDLVVHESEREEFSSWITYPGDPGYRGSRQIERAPLDFKDLVSWLKRPREAPHLRRADDWQEKCRTNFNVCMDALNHLAGEKSWDPDYWGRALQVWREPALLMEAWECVGPSIESMPDEILLGMLQDVSFWLREVGRPIETHEDRFLRISRWMLELFRSPEGSRDHGSFGDAVDAAINHPVGNTALAQIDFWVRKQDRSEQVGLDARFEPIFTQIADRSVEPFRHARLILASQLNLFVHVDLAWTEKHLLPLFDWNQNPIEARVAWHGLFFTYHATRPALQVIKPHLLQTARHFSELGRSGGQYASFMTYVVLEGIDGYSRQDLRQVFEELPGPGLEASAETVLQALSASADRRGEYWANRVRKVWEIWPKSRTKHSQKIAGLLARIAISAGEGFPDAVAEFRDWFQPQDSLYLIDQELKNAKHCLEHPVEALDLLNRLLDENTRPWGMGDVKDRMKEITDSRPELKRDPRFIRIIEILRSQGIDVSPL